MAFERSFSFDDRENIQSVFSNFVTYTRAFPRPLADGFAREAIDDETRWTAFIDCRTRDRSTKRAGRKTFRKDRTRKRNDSRPTYEKCLTYYLTYTHTYTYTQANERVVNRPRV